MCAVRPIALDGIAGIPVPPLMGPVPVVTSATARKARIMRTAWVERPTDRPNFQSTPHARCRPIAATAHLISEVMIVGEPSIMNTPKIRGLGIVQHGSLTRGQATGYGEGIGWIEAWGTTLIERMEALQARAAKMAMANGTEEDRA